MSTTVRLPVRAGAVLTSREEREQKDEQRRLERAERKKKKKKKHHKKKKAESSSSSSSSSEQEGEGQVEESSEEERIVPGAKGASEEEEEEEAEPEAQSEEEEEGESKVWWGTTAAKRLLFRDKPLETTENVAPCSSAPGFFVHVCEGGQAAVSVKKAVKKIKETKSLGAWRKQLEECGILVLGMPAKHITFDRSQLCQADLWFLQNEDTKERKASIAMSDLRTMLGLPASMSHIVVTRLAVHQTLLRVANKSVIGGACDLLCGDHSLTKRAVAIGKPGSGSGTTPRGWASPSALLGSRSDTRSGLSGPWPNALEAKTASAHHQVTVFNVTTNVSSHGGGVPAGLSNRPFQKPSEEGGGPDPSSFFIPNTPQVGPCEAPYVVSAADPCLFEDASPAHLWIGHHDWSASLSNCPHVEFKDDKVLLDVVDPKCPSRAASIYTLLVLWELIVRQCKTIQDLVESKCLVGDDADPSTRSRLCIPLALFQPLVAKHRELYDAKQHAVLDTTTANHALHLRYRLVGQRPNEAISELSLAARVSVEFYAGGSSGAGP